MSKLIFRSLQWLENNTVAFNPGGLGLMRDILMYVLFLIHQTNIIHNINTIHIIYMGVEGDWDFRISDLVKNPDGTDILPLW